LQAWADAEGLTLSARPGRGRSFAEALTAIPCVGTDADFER
jgi:hypothetical protein